MRGTGQYNGLGSTEDSLADVMAATRGTHTRAIRRNSATPNNGNISNQSVSPLAVDSNRCPSTHKSDNASVNPLLGPLKKGETVMVVADIGPNGEGTTTASSTTTTTLGKQKDQHSSDSTRHSIVSGELTSTARTLSNSLMAIWTKWRAHFLLLLLLFIAISLVFIAMDGAKAGELRSTRSMTSTATGVAATALQMSQHCVESRRKAFHSPVEAPAVLVDFRETVVKLEKKRKVKVGTYTIHIDAAIDALAIPDCELALQQMSKLYAVLALAMQSIESGSHRSLSVDHTVATFPLGWTMSLGQLRSESHLRYSERTPLGSKRALLGVSSNFLCTNQPLGTFALETTPALLESLYCDNVSRNQLLEDLPVLRPPQIDIEEVFPLFTYLFDEWAVRVPYLTNKLTDANYTVHFAVHGAIILTAIVGFYVLIRIAVARREQELTEAIVRQDFRLVPINRRKDTAVAMTQQALRLIDHYCWRLGDLGFNAGPAATAVGVAVVSDDPLADVSLGRSVEKYHTQPQYGKGTLVVGEPALLISATASPYDGVLCTPAARALPSPPATSNDMLPYSLGAGCSLPLTAGPSAVSPHRQLLLQRRHQLEARPRTMDLPSRIARYNMRHHLVHHSRRGEGVAVDFNELLLSQAGLRNAVLRDFAAEYAAMRDATQVQLYLHQLVHPLMLVRSFIPPYVVRPTGLSPADAQNIGPSLGMEGIGAGIVMSEGLEDDWIYSTVDGKGTPLPNAKPAATTGAAASSRSASPADTASAALRTAYLYVSFRTFNTPEALRKATHHYERKAKAPGGIARHLSVASRSVVNGAGSVLGEDGLQATDVAVLVDEGEQGHPSDSDEGETPTAAAQPTPSGKRGGDAKVVLGGRLTDGRATLRKVSTAANSLTAALAALAPGETDSMNPFSVDSDGRDQTGGSALSDSYPLSAIAAGVNIMLHNVRTASEVFRGSLVQISSDGVLVQFRPTPLAGTQQTHCFVPLDSSAASARLGAKQQQHQNEIARMSVEERAARTSLLVEEGVRHYLDTCDACLVPANLLHCPQLILSDESCPEWLHALAEKTAAAAAGGASTSGSVSFSAGTNMVASTSMTSISGRGGGGRSGSGVGFGYGSGAEAVGGVDGQVADPVSAGSLRGLVEFHVTKHYCVLSRCMPLIFALEQVALECGSRHVLVTRAVQQHLGNLATTRPLHYLDIPNLNLYYFRQRQRQEQFHSGSSSGGGSGLATVSASSSFPSSADGSVLGASPSDDISGVVGAGASTGAAAAPATSAATSNSLSMTPIPESIRLDNQSAAERQHRRPTGCAGTMSDLPFTATGTVYELQAIQPMNENSTAFETYRSQRDRTQARREHWCLVWSRYEEVLRRRPSVRALQGHLDRLAHNTAPKGFSELLRSNEEKKALASTSASADSGDGHNNKAGGGGGPGTNASDIVMLLGNERESRQEKEDKAVREGYHSTSATDPCTRRGHSGSTSVAATTYRELMSANFSAVGSSSNVDTNSMTGSAGCCSSVGGSFLAQTRRTNEANSVAALVTKLAECLKELGSYHHIYGTLSKQEEYTFNSVVDDLMGMLLALGVPESEIEW